MSRSLLVLALLGATLPGATVELLDGRRQDLPDLTALSSLPLRDTDRVILGDAPPARPGLGVWLADGSWVPAQRLAADGVNRLRIDGPLGTCTVPLAAVRGWGTTEPASATAGDRVALGGGPVEGQVTGLGADSILRLRTTLDPEPIAVPLADVASASLQVAALAPVQPALVGLLAEDRPPTRFSVGPAGLVLGVGGSPVVAPPTALVVEGPRRHWLADLTPQEVVDEGAFGVVWPWTRNTDLEGGPLRLGGRRALSGLTVHSVARLTWNLAGAYTQLRGRIGISDLVGAEGDADVRLLVDGREAWRERRLRGGEAPRDLQVDLVGVRTLSLVVDLGERYDIGDHVSLVDAALIRP